MLISEIADPKLRALAEKTETITMFDQDGYELNVSFTHETGRETPSERHQDDPDAPTEETYSVTIIGAELVICGTGTDIMPSVNANRNMRLKIEDDVIEYLKTPFS